MQNKFGENNTRTASMVVGFDYTKERDRKEGKYKYLGIDLDNTLHDFKGTAKVAMDAIYTYLEKKTGISPSRLIQSYKNILEEAESKGFTKDISRKEYRERRFSKLLEEFDISPEYINDLLEIYEKNFVENLHAYEQMVEFLEKVHEELGLKVIVISEGPRDAQEITLEKLGIKGFVDKLFTASVEGTSKTENLFPVVLNKLKCQPKEIFYIGDSEKRDITPAKQADIDAILFNSRVSLEPQIAEFYRILK